MSTMPRYHINVFWHPDDECWIADVPDLRPCSAHGETPEQAVANVRNAIEGWLEIGGATGQPVPEPRYCPAIYAGR